MCCSSLQGEGTITECERHIDMPAVIQSLDIENEYEYVEKYSKILEANPETREIKPRGENYMSGILSDIKKKDAISPTENCIITEYAGVGLKRNTPYRTKRQGVTLTRFRVRGIGTKPILALCECKGRNFFAKQKPFPENL